ncbi:MAG: ATP-grasp domain-containing protein [Planctomycetota bacterium]
MIWLLERGVFDTGDEFADAAARADHRVIQWDDDWLTNGRWPPHDGEKVAFRGSLGNAVFVHESTDWKPGSWCDAHAFHCSSWYPQVSDWLLHQAWRILPTDEFVANPDPILAELGVKDECFVRPDSPLKPFSGRVLARDAISLDALDHGFYFDEADIPIVVAPVREVDREWRFVVVDQKVVAGCAYEATSRSGTTEASTAKAKDLASSIASSLKAPADVYVLDICESDGLLFLLELNPFGGADLYRCDASEVIAAIAGYFTD